MKKKMNLGMTIGCVMLGLQACGDEPQAQLNYRHRERIVDVFSASLAQVVEAATSLDSEDLKFDGEFKCDKGAMDFAGLVSASSSGYDTDKRMDLTLSAQPNSCLLQAEGAADIKLFSSDFTLTAQVTYDEEPVVDPQTGEPVLDPMSGEPLKRIVSTVERASFKGSARIDGEGNVTPGDCRVSLEYAEASDNDGDAKATITGDICGEAVERTL